MNNDIQGWTIFIDVCFNLIWDTSIPSITSECKCSGSALWDCVRVESCLPSGACGSSSRTSWWAYPRTWPVWEPPYRVCRLDTQAHVYYRPSLLTNHLKCRSSSDAHLPSRLWRTEWVTGWTTGSICPWCSRSRWLSSRCTGTRCPPPNEGKTIMAQSDTFQIVSIYNRPFPFYGFHSLKIFSSLLVVKSPFNSNMTHQCWIQATTTSGIPNFLTDKPHDPSLKDLVLIC